MERPYRQIDVRREGEVSCVRLRRHQLDETQLYEMCGELVRLVERDGFRKMVLNLGPPDPEFLYSIFLAKLVGLQRRLRTAGGGLKITSVSPVTLSIFAACGLDKHFEFVADDATAVQQFAAGAPGHDMSPSA
jgi:anti-anti-sigma factor